MIKDVIMHIGDASMRYQVMTKPDPAGTNHG
jgi:hypothetical protein